MRPTDTVYPEETGQEPANAVPEITEPVVHMWTPLHLEVDTDYAFVPEGAGFTRASRRLKDFAYWFLPRYNRFMFGLEITGQENLNGITGGAVTICNHVHILDCSMVAGAWENRRRPYFPTLKSNFEIPGIRHLVRLLGGVPIPTTAHAMGAFAQAVRELLERGEVR